MDRFDKFLSSYLPKYIENDLINEIIITDETGEDIIKIEKAFPNNKKLQLIKNETILGPLLNKLKACSLSSNEWIALMDSDNFADKDYFIKAKEYLEKNIKYEKNIILAPSKANPNFNYSHLSGFVYKKGEFTNNLKKENELSDKKFTSSIVLMNTGNYVINKYLINNLNLQKEMETIGKSPCDVIYLNTLLFEQLDLNMHIVPNMEYEHVVHEGSTYTQTSHIYTDINNMIHRRYENLYN
jgi:hypothetical protein